MSTHTQVSPPHYRLLLPRAARKISCSFEQQRFKKKERKKELPWIKTKNQKKRKKKKKSVKKGVEWEDIKRIQMAGKINNTRQVERINPSRKEWRTVEVFMRCNLGERYGVVSRLHKLRGNSHRGYRHSLLRKTWPRVDNNGASVYHRFFQNFSPPLNFPANIKIYERARLKRANPPGEGGKYSSFKMENSFQFNL